MSIIIALSGANGRMGKSIVKAASCNSEYDIALKLTRSSNNNLLTTLNNIKPDVFIDFSTTDACLQYLEICKQLKIPMVIGTTGFTVQQKEKISSSAEHIPILLSPNMSIGANICNYLLGCLSKLLVQNQQFENAISIKEVHHKHKLDAPSGTALRMADIIKKNFLDHANPIEFISKRVGNVKGRHEITFSNKFESIIIKHNVKNRSVFANGALFAARWLVNKNINNKYKPYKLYGLLDVMNFEEILKTGILF